AADRRRLLSSSPPNRNIQGTSDSSYLTRKGGDKGTLPNDAIGVKGATMMTTQSEPTDRTLTRRPPVFHVRVLRELYGGHGIPVEDLAALAGIAPALVEAYEACS